MPGGSQHRAATVTTVAVAAATLLVLLVGIWAASAGPDDPFRGEGPMPDRVSTSTIEPAEPPSAPPPEDVDDSTATSTGWVTTVIVVILAVIVAMLLATVVRLLVTAWPGLPRWRRRSHRDEPEVVVDVDPVATVSAAITADADDQERLLGAGTPRNGIVECWHRFEVQAERAGVPRAGWETSSEFTMRLLDLVEAGDASAVAHLSRLYREARFSEHPLGESDRADALAALRRIHHDLRVLLSGGLR